MVTIAPGSSLGRYRVIEQIGQGGMATVFRAHDPTLDREVAIKVLPSYHMEDPTFADRFAQEAQTVARLNHPNILQIYDFGEDKGFTFIVSELVPGGDLQDIITDEPMPAAEVLKYMAPLSGALDYAHGQGIVHRDLKPANVLLDQDKRPILADFGLARMLESTTRFTQQQQAIGDFGEAMAIAFQIRDDLLNLMTPEGDAATAPGITSGAYGKERGGDIAEGKRTLIIIDLLRKCDAAERTEVLGVLHAHRDATTPQQIERVIALASDHGAIAFAEEESRKRSDDAVRLLEALPDVPQRQLLGEMLEFFVHRAF